MRGQVKGFRNARFKGFSTQIEAELYIQEHSSSDIKPAASHSPPLVAAAAVSTAAVPSLPASISNKAVLKFAEKSQTDERPAPSKRRKIERTVPTGPTYRSNNRILRKVSVHLSFDGGSRGNPGVAGAGAEVIIRFEKLVPVASNGMKKNSTTDVIERRKIQIRYYLGNNHTNNQAEYQGVICGLHQILQEIKEYVDDSRTSKLDDTEHSDHPVLVHVDKIVIQGDSRLIIQQLNGYYQCNSKNIKEYYKQCQEYVAELRSLPYVQIDNIIYEHVYRNDNKIADGKCNIKMVTRQEWAQRAAKSTKLENGPKNHAVIHCKDWESPRHL